VNYPSTTCRPAPFGNVLVLVRVIGVAEVHLGVCI
jgi:hypothetical protein